MLYSGQILRGKQRRNKEDKGIFILFIYIYIKKRKKKEEANSSYIVVYDCELDQAVILTPAALSFTCQLFHHVKTK